MNQVVSKISRSGLPPLAYIKHSGHSGGSKKGSCTGGVFCPGYMSNMMGAKAESLEKNFIKRGLDFVRFDYTDCGASVDANFQPRFSFKQWKDDVFRVLDELTEGPQVYCRIFVWILTTILIGSSMGAWMSLLAALEKPDRISGLLLVAPSVDFASRFRKRIINTPELNEKFEKGEILMIDGQYGTYPVHIGFLRESQNCEILRNDIVEVNCPVRILHSTADTFAPFEISMLLMKKIRSIDVHVHLVKNSDHRMSSDSDIRLLEGQLELLFESVHSASKL